MTPEINPSTHPWLVPRFNRPDKMNAGDVRFPVIAFVTGAGRINHWRYTTNRACPYLSFGDGGAVAVSPNYPSYSLLADLYRDTIRYPDRYAGKSVEVEVAKGREAVEVVKIKFGKTSEEVRERAIQGAAAYNDYLFHWLYHPSRQNLVRTPFPLELLPPEVLLRRAGKSETTVRAWQPPAVVESKKSVNA